MCNAKSLYKLLVIFLLFLLGPLCHSQSFVSIPITEFDKILQSLKKAELNLILLESNIQSLKLDIKTLKDQLIIYQEKLLEVNQLQEKLETKYNKLLVDYKNIEISQKARNDLMKRILSISIPVITVIVIIVSIFLGITIEYNLIKYKIITI